MSISTIQRSNAIVRIAILGGVLGGLLAATAASAPAQAAPAPSKNCVVQLARGSSAPATLTCFASFTDMIAAGTHGRITNAPARAADAARSPAFLSRLGSGGKSAAVRPTANVQVALGLEFEFANYSGDALFFVGGLACTTTTLDTDYQVGVLPAGWNDRISSFLNFNNCFTKHYFWENFIEPPTATPYQDDQPVMPIVNGVNYDNNTRSIRWS